MLITGILQVNWIRNLGGGDVVHNDTQQDKGLMLRGNDN